MDSDKNILFRNKNTEIILLPSGEVEKKYLRRRGVGRDQRNLTYLMERFGSIFYDGWEIRTVRILWVAINKKSIGMEYITGLPMYKLKFNDLKTAEYIAGVWLSHYQNSIMENKENGTRYSDFSHFNCMVDINDKKFIVTDPGYLFGKRGYIYISIYEHLQSIFSYSIKNKYNPFLLINPFLKGYLIERKEKIYIRNIIKSFFITKNEIFRGYFKKRSFRSLFFVFGTLLLLPIDLIYVPLYLKIGNQYKK